MSFMNWWKPRKPEPTSLKPIESRTIVLKGTPPEIAEKFLLTFEHVTLHVRPDLGIPSLDDIRLVMRNLIADAQQYRAWERELRAEQAVIRNIIKRVTNEKADIEKKYAALKAETDDARSLTGIGPNVLVARQLVHDMIRRAQTE